MLLSYDMYFMFVFLCAHKSCDAIKNLICIYLQIIKYKPRIKLYNIVFWEPLPFYVLNGPLLFTFCKITLKNSI